MNRIYKILSLPKEFVEEQQKKAAGYNITIDTQPDNGGRLEVLGDYIQRETDRAICYVLRTTTARELRDGWACWIPKRIIAETNPRPWNEKSDSQKNNDLWSEVFKKNDLSL